MQVIHYMNRLFASVGLSSFLYGSVALGTYLPDGDIDVSVFCRDLLTPHEWSKRVKKALCSNSDRIRGVAFINAQVKIYKCIIDDVSIDVSGNQIGGLCTLCFLERMNQKFGKDDLLKKSIVLVKAWSYYEARILASHHGLLSTYAITVLILFILNAYYDELETPLQVLIKFFEYFSDFDWDYYGIGIQGAFLLDNSNGIVSPNHHIVAPQSSTPLLSGSSSLQSATSEHSSSSSQSQKNETAAHPHYSHATSTTAASVKNSHSTINDPTLIQHNFVCTDEFLKECVDRYGITTDRPFQRKFFNILDPARADNNLGRSVSRSNYLRICKVFKKGYNTLRQILNDNEPSQILTSFFRHSWSRNQSSFPSQNGKNGHRREVVTDMKKRNLLFQRKLEDFESHLDAAKDHLRLVQQNSNPAFPMGPTPPGNMLLNGAVVTDPSLLNGAMLPSALSPSIVNGGSKQKYAGAKQKQKWNGKQSSRGSHDSSSTADKSSNSNRSSKKWKQNRSPNSHYGNGGGSEAASPKSQSSKKSSDAKSSGSSSRKKAKHAVSNNAPTGGGSKKKPAPAKNRSHLQANAKKENHAADASLHTQGLPLEGGGYVLSLSDLVKTAKRKSKKGKQQQSVPHKKEKNTTDVNGSLGSSPEKAPQNENDAVGDANVDNHL